MSSVVEDLYNDAKDLSADKLLFNSEKLVANKEFVHNPAAKYRKLFFYGLGIVIILSLIVSLAFASESQPLNGVSYYNLSQYTDMWGSFDATNNGATNSSFYPSFNVSGSSYPNSSRFDGSADYLSSSISDGGMYAVSLWFNPDNNVVTSLPYETLLSSSDGNDTTLTLGGFGGAFADETITLGSQEHSASDRTYIKDTFTSGSWYHLVINWNSTVSRYDFFVDDVKRTIFDYNGGVAAVLNLDGLDIGRRFAGATGYYDGLMDEVKFFNSSLTRDQVTSLYDYGYSVAPPLVVSNSSTESTAVVKQVGSISFGGGAATTIFSSDFNVSINNTPLYGAYSFNIEANGANNVFCEILIDGISRVNLTRSQTIGNLGSVFLQFPTYLIENGSHNQALKCARTSGVGLTTISNAVGIGHFLVDEFNNTLPYNSTSVSSSVSSGSSYTLLDSMLVTVGNQSISGNLTHSLVVEGGLSYTNNAVVDALLNAYISINGTNSSFYPRDVSSGSSGSVALDMILENVTTNSTYNISIYGLGANADYNGSFTVKDLFLDDREVVGGTGIITGYSFYNDTNTRIFNVSESGNYNHPVSNAFSKLSYSINTSVDTTVTFYVKLIDGSNFTGINWTRDFSAGVVGVITGHDIFESLPLDTNYEVELWANCGTAGATCTIKGGSSLGYITDVTSTVVNGFNVTLYDAWDNTTISNFTVSNGGVHTSVDGVAFVVTDEATENLTIVANGYFNNLVTNHNTSKNLNTSMIQSIINFNAFQLITNNSLSGVNFNVSDGTNWQYGNSTFNLKAGSYNVTAVKSGYYNITQEITITALDNKTINITGLYNTIINFSAVAAFTGLSINNFTVNIPEQNSILTTNGTVYLRTIKNYNQTYNVSTIAYTTESSYIITNNSFYNLTVTLYDFNSVRLEIYNSTGGGLLTQLVNIEVINNVSSYNVSTTNGKYNLSLLQPVEYELRFRSNNFNSQSYFVTVVNDSTELIKIYLTLNTTNSPQLVRILDVGGTVVEGAIVWLQEQVINASPQWVTIQQGETNFEGETVFYVERDTSVFYRFGVVFNGVFVPIQPNNNFFTSKTFFLAGVDGVENEVIIIVNIASEIDDSISNREEVVTDGGVTGLINETVWCSWADPNNALTGARMIVKGKYSFTNYSYETLYDNTVYSTTGNLSYTFLITNNTIYNTNCYIVWSDSQEVFFTKISDFDFTVGGLDKNTGILYAVLIVLVCAFLSVQFGAMGSGIFVVLSLFAVKGLSLMDIPTMVITTFLAAIIIGFMEFKKRGVPQ